MGLKRLLFLVVLAAAIALGLASSAPAGNFDGDKMGCQGENPVTCPTGTTGQPYSLTIYLKPPDGGRGEDFGCATFHHTSGNFPPGLTIASEGVISGTPTQAGTYDFFLTVKYDKETTCPFKNPSDDRFIININQGQPAPPKLTLGPESTASGTTGTPYSLQMTASVEGEKTWAINSGSLPPGLSLNGSTGLISGTPTGAGTFTFEVLAKMVADERSDTKVLAIVVRDPLSVVAGAPFTATRTAAGEVSAPFEALLTASGGAGGPYAWSLGAGTLPPGLLLATDGAISGTPRAAGVYSFTARATDAEGRAATYLARVTIAQRLAIATRLVPSVRVKEFFRRKLATIGGMKPTLWRVVRGPLPRGVYLDRGDGILYGYPPLPGSFRVTLEATDSLGVKAKKTLSIVVLEPKK